MPEMIKGLELSRRFYVDLLKPFLDKSYPHLDYAAALVGAGSEVLGFDDGMSTDHDWGPRLFVFLREDEAHLSAEISERLSVELPYQFLGYSTNFVPVPDEPKTQVAEHKSEGKIHHRVYLLSLREFFWNTLAWDINSPLDAIDWLTFSSQELRTIIAGAVFHDAVSDLTRFRESFAWYPDDVWYYLIAAQWQRIGQEEHLMGRAGYVGDELGAALIASRLVQDIMRLCFLLEREYAPYPKWFGTAFSRLKSAKQFVPILREMQVAETWQKRQEAYIAAIELLVEKLNTVNIIEPIVPKVQQFHTRPFMVIGETGISQALLSKISDPLLVKLLKAPSLIGSIDQFSDNTDLRDYPSWRRGLRQLYESVL